MLYSEGVVEVFGTQESVAELVVIFDTKTLVGGKHWALTKLMATLKSTSNKSNFFFIL